MVAFRASIAGMLAPRTSADLDVLSNPYVHPDAVAHCARTVRALGFEVEEPHTSGHRFTRGRLVVDVLAPDHPPRRAALRTVGRRTRLRPADTHLAEADHHGWRALGRERQRAAYATWRLLVDGA